MRPRMLVFAMCATTVASMPYAYGASYPVAGGGEGISGSGTFYTTANGDGSETIVNITGTGVTGLLAVGGFNGNDNLMFPNATPVLDGSGVSFTDTMGDTSFDVDLFSNDGSYYAAFLDSDGVSDQVPITLQVVPATTPVSAVALLAGRTQNGTLLKRNFKFAAEAPETSAVTPEPSSIALLGTGLVGMAGVVRRRRE